MSELPARAAHGPSKPDANSLRARAVGELQRRISRLELAPGALISERELSEQLGMGKASIREALTQLTYARLVAPRSGSGYRVVPITLSGARDLFDLWRAIEGHAAAMAVERGIPASMMDRLENPDWSQLELEQSDPEFEAQRTVVFHFLVSTAGKSTRLTIAFSEMVIELERLLRFCLRLGLPGDQLAGGEADLVKALGGRKPELARAAAVKAVDGVQTLVLGSLVNSDAVLGMNLADLI